MWAPVRISLGLVFFCAAVMAAPPTREAANRSATPANQLLVSGNACGPAALLNAFRFGNTDWQRASDALGGDNDKDRIYKIIREIGMRPSKHVTGHPRWSRRGVSVADLRDMANEMTLGKYLPQLGEEVLFLRSRETPEKLLGRVHKILDTSLAKGFPPILSLRRFVLRKESGKPAEWRVVEAHFVTLVALPRKLDRNARSFTVAYIDPWGGKALEGSIGIPATPILPDASGRTSCLEAVFSKTSVGKDKVRRGETSVLAVSAVIGRW